MDDNKTQTEVKADDEGKDESLEAVREDCDLGMSVGFER